MTQKKLLLLLCILLLSKVYSQGGKVGIDTSSPHQKSVLDIVSRTNNTGVLFPRLTTSNIASIAPAAGDALVDGLWVYNTDTKCYNYWAGAPQNQWLEICGRPLGSGTSGVATVNCSGASSTGTLTSGQPATGVSFTVPYTAGNGGSYPSQSISSTGVSGLTANISAGNFNNGAGNLVFNITGTPSNSGTATFAINMGGSSCSVNIIVNGQAILNCGQTTTSGTLVANSTANGVSFTIPYSAGNGSAYPAQSIVSTGVSGLTANIAAGNFNNGSGGLTYTVSGTPAAAGTASFTVNVGGSDCVVNFTVISGFDLSKLKILALGAAPYSIDVGNSGSALGQAMYSPSNFGPSGTVKTIGSWDVTRRSVTSGGLTGLNSDGYKMLIVGYAYNVASSTDLNIILQFINSGGTVLWFTETSGSFTTQLVSTMAGSAVGFGSWGCTGTFFQKNLLNGDFGNAGAGGLKFGNDACVGQVLTGSFDNVNGIETMAISDTSSQYVAFKSKTKEFYWFGDGGMAGYSNGVPPVSGNRNPSLLDSSKRPVIGTWNGTSNVANSVVLLNIIAKALKNAQ